MNRPSRVHRQGRREGCRARASIALEPTRLVAARQAELCFLRQADEVLEMPAPCLVALVGRTQPLEGVVAHELKQGEARLVGLALRDKALVDKRGEPLQDGSFDTADGFGRRKRAPACEHAELREEPLRIGVEQVVAPVERQAEGPLVPRRVAAPAGEELEAISEPGEERHRRKQLGSRRGELDRERQAVEPYAQLGDRGRILLGQGEARIGGLRARDEELRRLVLGERRHGVLVLCSKVKRRAARHDHSQSRRCNEEPRHQRRGREHLLEIVDQQQQPRARQRPDQRLLGISSGLG